MRAIVSSTWTAVALAVSVSAQQSGTDPLHLTATLGHVENRVEEYYARAQSIVAYEAVRIERQLRDMTTVGHVRRLGYELRIEWTPRSDGSGAADAKVVRELVSVDGRPPRKGDEEACMDPEPVTPEPMMMLLPEKREDTRSRWRGAARRTAGRRS